MKSLRLILLASTAICFSQVSYAAPESFVVAQASPEQKAPEGAPPKQPPRPPVSPKAQPPRPPGPPHAQPPHPPATPPAPGARPVTPPGAPRAEPPRPAAPPQARPPVAPRPPQAAPQHAPSTPQIPGGAQQRHPEQMQHPAAPQPAQPQPKPESAQPIAPGARDVTPHRATPTPPPIPAPNAVQTPPGARPLPTPPAATPPGATPTPPAPNAPAAPGFNGQRSERHGPPPGLPPGTPAAPARAPVAAPLPPAPAPAAITPLPAAPGGGNRANFESFRSQRQETVQDGRTIIREPDRVIVKDPNGQAFIRHNEVDRFRYGARDIQTQRFGDNDTRTVIMRPDGSQIINEVGADGRLLRRLRRGRDGRDIVIIDNRPRGGGFGAGLAAGVVAGAIGGYFVSLPPPVLRIPQDRYIVDAEGAPPQVIYDTLEAPPVERLDRAYSLDEIRYSPSVRQRMPSIDLDTINFDTGSWDIPPDQASKLQAIADGLNRAIQRNPSEVFLIEGHTDAVGSDVDNLSLSDRRAEAAAELLSQQFGVPAENLVTQGYGEQYLKIPTDGPERQNRRVTVRRITPLLTGENQAGAPPPGPR